MKTIRQLNVKNKRVFVRLDLNVPVREGKILDDYRITCALPTLRYLLKKGAKQIIIGAHLGRPQGVDAALSFQPVAKRLSTYLRRKVILHKDVNLDVDAEQKIILLENLRFWEAEKKGDIRFARSLARFADVYVNDAFGTAHRKDASVYALGKLLPGAPGFLIEQELKQVHLHHNRPIVALFGAAKIEDKVVLLESLLKRVDKLLLGGGVVFTFLAAMGVQVGTSLVEPQMYAQAKSLLNKYADKIVFPVDFVVASKSALKKMEQLPLSERKKFISVTSFERVPKHKACFDIGPQSVKLFSAVIARAKTVVWNGPMGLFEVKPFDKATRHLAKTLSQSNCVSIICGGDTAEALRKTPYASAMTHISTGGGASLQLLGGRKLVSLRVFEN